MGSPLREPRLDPTTAAVLARLVHRADLDDAQIAAEPGATIERVGEVRAATKAAIQTYWRSEDARRRSDRRARRCPSGLHLMTLRRPTGRHPLTEEAGTLRVTGDLVRCRACTRAQQRRRRLQRRIDRAQRQAG